LISYGTDFANGYHLAATYVAKILKGAKPDELPVMQPTKFELLINLKTARTLGIAVLQTLQVAGRCLGLPLYIGFPLWGARGGSGPRGRWGRGKRLAARAQEGEGGTTRRKVASHQFGRYRRHSGHAAKSSGASIRSF
jgi:ABC transporter substrate binding protein